MKHRIVVLGAGYAGAQAANLLARRIPPEDAEVVLVNAESGFVERMRLHQVAAGQDLEPRLLAAMFTGTGVDLRIASVTAVDADARTVALDHPDGRTEILGYDTLVYALGSAVNDNGVPGAAEHAHQIASRPGALLLRDRLRSLAEGSHLLFVGEGLTGIEGVTETAESYPHLDVALVARGEPGAWLSAGAQRHLARAFDRLGVTVLPHTAVARVEPGAVITEDGTAIAADATVWTGGFAVHPIADASALSTADNGQILVDRDMRSVSHPEVLAIGDAARAVANSGLALPMSCYTAGVTAMAAVNTLTAALKGHRALALPPIHYGNHISLGRRDAIIQALNGGVRSFGWYLGGRTAARLKEAALRGVARNVDGADLQLPVRARRVRVRPARATT
jgi:NADH:ubiquinone reductase (H+-translocating)